MGNKTPGRFSGLGIFLSGNRGRQEVGEKFRPPHGNLFQSIYIYIYMMFVNLFGLRRHKENGKNAITKPRSTMCFFGSGPPQWVRAQGAGV